MTSECLIRSKMLQLYYLHKIQIFVACLPCIQCHMHWKILNRYNAQSVCVCVGKLCRTITWTITDQKITHILRWSSINLDYIYIFSFSFFHWNKTLFPIHTLVPMGFTAGSWPKTSMGKKFLNIQVEISFSLTSHRIEGYYSDHFPGKTI